MRAAASRTFCTAGKRRPMRIAMIAITTRSSISVNARRERRGESGMAAPRTESDNETGRFVDDSLNRSSRSLQVEGRQFVWAVFDRDLELRLAGVAVAAL